MEDKIKNWIKEILEIENDIVLVHPKDIKNGDYTFISAPESTEEYFKKLDAHKISEIGKIEVADRFINFQLSREFFSKSIEEILGKGADIGKNNLMEGKKFMVEYTDPNPFKPFHIGHLMTNAIGESIARILEHAGADVSRANYQGDIGLHVAKAIYGLLKNEELQGKAGNHVLQASNIGHAYVLGANAYEEDEQAKKEVDELNKKIYERTDDKINAIYDWGFDVTMEAFEDLYKMLGTKFDYYFLESAMADIGRDIIRDNMVKAMGPESSRGIFEESDGAVVFKAEKYDPKLHTRVFITSQGLPTYETKELGLNEEKFKTKPGMDLSIVITANEQMDYMRVVSKALSLIYPGIEEKMKHITHGMMRLASGKMGSRKGNAVTGESLINDAREAVFKKMSDREFSEEERESIVSDVACSSNKILYFEAGNWWRHHL